MLQQRQNEILQRLRNDLLQMEGLRISGYGKVDKILGPLKTSLPGCTLPLGVVHEFLVDRNEATAATTGFISHLLHALMQPAGIAFWISSRRKIFPPSLRRFGLLPDRIVFVDLNKDKDVLWAIDEALKCGAITAVIGEVNALDFTASRRMQLAAEHSGVTCFVLRKHSQLDKLSPTASVSRWRVTHLPSIPIDTLPGIGYPQWKVELLRIRNGKPGTWNLMWWEGRYHLIDLPSVAPELQKKAG